MKCLILAAGYATRLYPLTENYPKPLLQVGEKTILDWLVDDLNSAGGITEYIVVSNHRYVGHFEAWAAKKQQTITVLDDGSETNESRRGAVMDIWFAVDQLGLDEQLLVIAGDNVLDFSLRRFLDYAKEKETSCVMRYFEPSAQRLRKCGVLRVREDDRVLSMVEKSPDPPSNWACPPFYVYSRKAVRLLPEAIGDGCGTDAPGSFIAWLCQKEPVYAMEMPGSRYDIGNLESYERVQKEYKGIC